MKKEITKTVEFCDACGKECQYPSHCRECGRAFCYDCSKEYSVTYLHGVHFGGSGDGCYCIACDEALRKIPDRSKETKLHQAYLKISSLRLEYNKLYEDIDKRTKVAEAELKGLLT